MLYAETKGTNSKQIIFLHGNSQSLSLWDKVIADAPLQDGYTLVTVDLPGHGKSFRSSNPEKDYSLQGMAAHLLGFIQQYEKEDYIIVANSLATNLIGEVADKLASCKGIFLTGACIVGEGINLSQLAQVDANIAPFFTTNPTEDAVDKMIEDGGFQLSTETKADIKQVFYNTDPRVRVHIGASIAKGEWTDEIKKLDKLAVPIAIVYGKEEKFANINYFKDTSLNKWRGTIIAVPNARHFIQLDQPVLLAQLIKEFAEDCFK